MKTARNGLMMRRRGFAMTIEVIFTLMTIALMVNASIYMMSMFNSHRYMHTVATATATQIAKWGGTESNAYKANNMNYNVIENAQNELNRTASILNPTITGSPKVIKGNDKVEVKLTWRYPQIYIWGGMDGSLTINVDPIMKPGDLLGG